MAPPLREDRINILLHIRDGVELIEIEIVRPQPLQGFLQLGRCLFPGPVLGLAGEKDILAIRLQGRPELDFGVAVARGDIEVVDALLHRLRHDPIGVVLLDAADHDAAEADDGQSLARVAQRPAGAASADWHDKDNPARNRSGPHPR